MARRARGGRDRAGDIDPAGKPFQTSLRPVGSIWGLSAYYARSDDEVVDLGEDRLDAFESLFVYRLIDVVGAGFGVVPTFRSPHVTITFYDDVAVGVARLLAVAHRTIANPAYRQEES